MARSKSSKKWLEEHFEDVYVKKAQQSGYRSRAVFKLKELDDNLKLFRPGMRVVDLGAAPGGWSQYVALKIAGKGAIYALDILPMDPIPGVEIIEGDFNEEEVFNKLLKAIPGGQADRVLSDMAPNMSGIRAVDIPRAMALVELVVDFAKQILKPGGILVMKVFHGEGFDSLLKEVRTHFQKVIMKKPRASRARSRETYMVAIGFSL